jgi:serine/threonine-protein phosphatase 2B catalytic subunit
MTSYFNFRIEILEKFDEEIYDLVMDTFDHLPIAALIGKKILAIHGGISPELKTVDLIDNVNRH